MSEPVYPTVDPAAEQGCEHGHIGACTACFAEDERARNEARIDELEDQLAIRDREIARLAAHRLAVAQKVGIVYQADGHADEPGPDESVIETIGRLVFERDTVLDRLEISTDWYQQRFNRLRKWIEEEVRPLSEDAAHRYYAICANGSPAPHESAGWTDTLHAARLERDAALARVRELTESNARLLADLGNSSARIQELQEGNDMACESPPVGCDCPGCSLARELAKEAPRG